MAWLDQLGCLANVCEPVDMATPSCCVCCCSQGGLLPHPIFELELCTACHQEYTTHMWTCDSDGDEDACRVCSFGGRLLMCSSQGCTHAFCEGCVMHLLGAAQMGALLRGCWDCFLCSPCMEAMPRNNVGLPPCSFAPGEGHPDSSNGNDYMYKQVHARNKGPGGSAEQIESWAAAATPDGGIEEYKVHRGRYANACFCSAICLPDLSCGYLRHEHVVIV